MPCGSPSQLRNLALNFESSGWSPGLWCCLLGALPISDTILRLLTFHAESCPAPMFLGPVEPSRPLTGPHVRAVPRPCGAWQPRGGQLAARFWDPAGVQHLPWAAPPAAPRGLCALRQRGPRCLHLSTLDLSLGSPRDWSSSSGLREHADRVEQGLKAAQDGGGQAVGGRTEVVRLGLVCACMCRQGPEASGGKWG